MNWRELAERMTIANWITVVAAVVGLIGTLMRLLWQWRRRRAGRSAVVTQGATWRGEPVIIVHGWIEINGTFTPNKSLRKEMRKARERWLRS